MPKYTDRVREIFTLYLNRLERQEKDEMLYLASKWGIVEKSLETKIDSLVKISLEKQISRNQLYRLDEYKDLLLISKKEINQFNRIAANTISSNQELFLESGLKASQNSISLLKISFNKVDVNSVNNMIGFTKDGTPLFELLNKSYPETISKITNTLIESTALGRNPLTTARLLKDDMNGNLNRAIKVARTEQMNTFREANKLQMKESGVVKGFQLITEDDACELCMSQKDIVFEFDESPELHPNCRCGFLPIL